VDCLENDGFEILKNFIPIEMIEQIKEEVAHYDAPYPKYGIRNADKKFTMVSMLMRDPLLVKKATELLGAPPQIVRVIFFDKTEENNWLVPWHQDRTIALNKKVDIDGWGRWSVKDGVDHVQPSVDVLDNMVTFRMHLDDSDRNNGCLKVIPRTHTRGLLSQKEIHDITAEEKYIYCEVKAGDVVLMRPHILHASSKCVSPKHRRIVHIEYSNYQLSYGLEWM
jgi:hypothetical protein